MSANIDAFQALLAKMRDEFLCELPERCDRLDKFILATEKTSGNRDVFNELYRGVHSLKGSGGTHGLSIITTLCHQLENHLAEADTRSEFGEAFASRALAYVDLLRRVKITAQQSNPNYLPIEADMAALRHTSLQSRKIGLIAESSPMMVSFYRQALAELPLQLNTIANGLTALERLLHEHYDFVIVGREIKELNGIAIITALRASHAVNQDIPAILVSSKLSSVPRHAAFHAAILRDQNLAVNLIAAMQGVLGKL